MCRKGETGHVKKKKKKVSREAGLGSSAKTTQKGTLILYLGYLGENNLFRAFVKHSQRKLF